MRTTARLVVAAAVVASATAVFSREETPAPRLETKLEAAHLRHGVKTVTALATSGDGKTLASSGEPGGVKVWDLATRQLVKSLDGPAEEWLALSNDGRRIAALRGDAGLRLQDARPGDAAGPKCMLVEPAPAGDKKDERSPLPAVAVSRDGTRIAAVIASSVKVWSFATGDEEKAIEQEGARITAVAFSADGKQLATLTPWKLHVYELATGKAVETRQIRPDDDERGARHEPRSLVFANGPFIRWVCCYAIFELDLREGEDAAFPVAALPFWAMDRENAIAFWPDGAAFAASAHGDVIIERPGSNKRTLRGNVGAITALAPVDKKTLVSGGRDGTIRVWDLENEEEVDPAPGHLGSVIGVGFGVADDKPLLASVSAEAATGWDLDTKKGRHLDVTREKITATAFLAKSPWVVVGELDGSARVVNAQTGAMRASVELGSTVRAIGAAPDGRRLAFGLDDRSLRIHDAFDLAEVANLSGFENYFSSIAFAPDGRRIAVACSSPKVRFFAPNGRGLGTITTPANVTLLAFAPDGKMLAATHDDGTITIHDEKGAIAKTLTLKVPPLAIAFSNDGRELLLATPRSGDEKDTVRVVDIASGEEHLVGDVAKTVTSLAVQGDGTAVACGHDDGSVTLWKWR